MRGRENRKFTTKLSHRKEMERIRISPTNYFKNINRLSHKCKNKNIKSYQSIKKAFGAKLFTDICQEGSSIRENDGKPGWEMRLQQQIQKTTSKSKT